VNTCRDCARALNPYLDRELSDDDVIQVRSHLEACGGCLHLYQFEESLRRLVRVRCQQQGAPASLRERISVSLAMERIRLEQRGRATGPRQNPQQAT
jgi:mycothiol system anti-sigma-R factor